MNHAGINLEPPPGFQGLHPDKPLRVYQRHLPHWRQDGATYFVTFRLGDSLPQSKLNFLRRLREDWKRRHAAPQSQEALEQLARAVMEHVERWLDQGYGCCLLREHEAAEVVSHLMHRLDGDRYELGCYVVMPNHVHAIVKPLRPSDQPLERILQTWKGCTAVEINRSRQAHGRLWQEESFDRIIRDAEHLYRCIQYIGRNPRNAKLTPGEFILWICPEWQSLGWTFEDPGRSTEGGARFPSSPIVRVPSSRTD